MRPGTRWNLIVALGASLLCAAIVALTLGLVGARGNAQQASLDLEQREGDLAQARSDLEQAQARQAPRVPALEQARLQLKAQNRELSAQVEALTEERDYLNASVEFLQQGRRGSRAPALEPFTPSADPGESEPAPEAAHQELPTQEPAASPAVSNEVLPAMPVESPEPGRENPPDSNPGPRIEPAAADPDLQVAHQTVASLEQRAEELRAIIGSLEQRENGLRAVIAALEEDRQALAVQAHEMFPVCSGSMEPKITCLDTVVLLENFLPQDIQVGTVIAFIPSPSDGEETLAATPVLHRVAEVKREDGIYHYWPKGDAWEESDGYWVPENSVMGYVIELRPGTRPQNESLRDLVNRTRDRYAASRDRMAEARERYDQAVITHCGSLEAAASCEATPEGFDLVEAAFDAFTRSWNDYVTAVCEYDKAYFHGLHESEPNDANELTPYVAPVHCNGAG